MLVEVEGRGGGLQLQWDPTRDARCLEKSCSPNAAGQQKPQNSASSHCAVCSCYDSISVQKYSRSPSQHGGVRRVTNICTALKRPPGVSLICNLCKSHNSSVNQEGRGDVT